MLSIANSLASLSASLLDIIRSGLKLSLPFISSQQLGESSEVGQFSLDETTFNNNAKLFTGTALNFDGTNDEVQVSNNAAFNFGTGDFTVVFWINKSSAGSGDQRVIDKRSSSKGYTVYLDTNNILYLELNDGTGNGTFNLGTITDDVYQRIVISADRSGDAICYINNVAQTPVDISAKNGDLDDTTNLFIGADAPSGGSIHLRGNLSDFQLWNVAWSATDVDYDYTHPNQLVATLPVANLKAWWAMTEGSGSTIKDSSGQGNDGTISGATYATGQSSILQLGMINWSNGSGVFLPPSPTNPTQDIAGNAVRDRLGSINLTGKGYAEVADDDTLDFGTGAFSIECWAKADFVNLSSSVNVLLALGGQYAASDSISFASTASPAKFRVRISSVQILASSDYTVGRWYHLCATRDASSNLEFYIDSVSQGTSSSASASVTNTNVKLIGRDSNAANRFYSNLINGVRIYNVQLTEDQVKQNYNAGTSAHTN